MTDDEIIKIVREAGVRTVGTPESDWLPHREQWLRVARAVERDAMERAARVCETKAESWRRFDDCGFVEELAECAAAIRAEAAN